MMPGETKIALSDKELSLVQNGEWILTKEKIIQKVYDLFSDNVKVIQAEILSDIFLPLPVRSSVPKIFRGERYRQLPYVIMDYPRCFDKENIFAVRTMFWWGNFFSITLHVAGIYKMLVAGYIYRKILLGGEGLYMGVNENQWEHHFEADNFLPYEKMPQEKQQSLFEENDFIKLAMRFELGKWNQMPGLLTEGYKKINEILVSCQGDGKAL